MLISHFIQNGSHRKTSQPCTLQLTVADYYFRQLPVGFVVCLADPNAPDLLYVHSREMCCFQNSSTGRTAVWNMELNTGLALAVWDMVIFTSLSAMMFCKMSLYMLTDCSAACLPSKNRWVSTTPWVKALKKKKIHIFCTQGMVDKYSVQVSISRNVW